MRKFRFIFVISVLILSLALPCFATVTESSGDGFALYNGVKLPNIDSVWIGEVKAQYPYAIVAGGGPLYYLWLFETEPVNNGSGIPVFGAYRYASTLDIDVANQYGAEVGVWIGIGVDSTEGSYILNYIWTSHDVILDTDNSIYHTASTPIPLDGMEVIEWDGDLDDVISFASYAVKLGDYFPASSGLAVYRSGADLLLCSCFEVVSEASSSGWFVLSSDNDQVAAGVEYESSFPSGFYLFYHQADSYTQLFAYRESETEGPTGAVTGLTITYPPVGESDFIAYAGSDVQCTATVTGTGDFNPAVTWSVQYSAEYNPDVYPTISETGLLHLPATMLEQRIVVVATSVEDPTIGAIVPIYIMPPAVSSVTITPSSATAAPGQNVQFSATVFGSNVVDSAVTWAVGGVSSASTRITVDGLLLIGSDEVSPVIAVRATSNQDSSVYATALVNINIPAAVTGVTIIPDDIVLNRGDMQQFTATVSGTGSFDSSVTWQITSVYSAGTSITNNGLLTVSNEQKYDYIIIKATSTADPTKSAVAYVFVEDAVSDPMNIDLSVLERLLSQIEQYTKSIQYMLSYQNWFREFDFTTGQLSTQEDYIVGLVPNFYRFMQNMEQYVGQLAYRTASGSELNSRNEFTGLWDALFNFQSFQTSAGSSLGAGVFFKDTGKIFTIFTNFNGYFDTGYGIDDLWDYFNTDHISSFLSYETAYDLNPLAVAAPSDDSDPFNMSYYWEHQNEAQAWRDKYK